MSFEDHPQFKPATPLKISGALFLLMQITIVLWGVTAARPFLIPVLLAALLAFLATPLVERIGRLKIPDPFAIFITIVIGAIPFFFIGYAIVKEIQALISDWPSILASSKQYLASMSQSSWAIRLHLDDNLNLNSLQETFVNRAGQGVQFALMGLSAIMGASSLIFLIIMFAVLMVATRAQLRRGAESIIAHNKTVVASTLIDEVLSLIQNFLLARFIIMVVIGSLGAVIAFGFQVKYSLLLGGILGLATLIPNVGMLLGMTPPIIVALASDHSGASIITMLGVYIFLGFFESNILAPKLMGGRVNINSLSAFLGLFAGSMLLGVWGMLLSIPVLGIIRICLTLSPATRPWAELLAEREDRGLMNKLLRKADDKT